MCRTTSKFFDWYSLEVLPTLMEKRITSAPVLFVVNDLVYAGHYHMNGFFYNDSRRDNSLFMAKGKKIPETGFAGNFDNVPFVESWCYLN